MYNKGKKIRNAVLYMLFECGYTLNFVQNNFYLNVVPTYN